MISVTNSNKSELNCVTVMLVQKKKRLMLVCSWRNKDAEITRYALYLVMQPNSGFINSYIYQYMSTLTMTLRSL